MSQHHIVGSEAFNRSPFVIIRAVKTGSFRRRKARTGLAFVLGAVVSAVGATALAATAVSQGLLG